MGLVGLIVIGGFFGYLMMNKLRWNTALILKIKLGHKVRTEFINFNT